MVIVADLPARPSSADVQTLDTVHGIPLADLLARCRSMAHRFYRKHGRWEPLEEYISAGHMALTEYLGRYDSPLAPPGGFLSYCCFQMEMKMRDVRLKAAGINNMRKPVKGERRDPKYTVEGWDHEQLYTLRTLPATQETTTFLHEVLTYLASQGKPAAMLLAGVDGEPVEAIAASWHCTGNNVTGHCMKLRKKLRAWAYWSTEALCREEMRFASAD